MNVLLSIIVGLFGGIGLAFFFEYLDNTIKGHEDAELRLVILMSRARCLFWKSKMRLLKTSS